MILQSAAASTVPTYISPIAQGIIPTLNQQFYFDPIDITPTPTVGTNMTTEQMIDRVGGTLYPSWVGDIDFLNTPETATLDLTGNGNLSSQSASVDFGTNTTYNLGGGDFTVLIVGDSSWNSYLGEDNPIIVNKSSRSSATPGYWVDGLSDTISAYISDGTTQVTLGSVPSGYADSGTFYVSLDQGTFRVGVYDELGLSGTLYETSGSAAGLGSWNNSANFTLGSLTQRGNPLAFWTVIGWSTGITTLAGYRGVSRYQFLQDIHNYLDDPANRSL